MIIYKITNKINGKLYIGQTINSLKDRWQNHCKQKGQSRSAMRSAVHQYGKENFTIEIIDTAESLYELNLKEIQWIKNLNTLSPNGYNLEGGGKNKEVHLESRLKMSLAKKGRHFIMSDSAKQNISKGKKGKPLSKKHKDALSLARKDKKKVRCLTTGVIYNSFAEAARILCLALSGVARCANGERKSCGGLKFEVLSEQQK